MKNLCILALLLLAACGSDVPNTVTAVNITAGTSECPTEVVVETTRNELYYAQLGWFTLAKCVDSPEGLIGQPVIKESGSILISGRTQIPIEGEYGVYRSDGTWFQLEWWKYKE